MPLSLPASITETFQESLRQGSPEELSVFNMYVHGSNVFAAAHMHTSRRLSDVRVLYDNQYELLVGCDHDLSVATSHPQHAQFVRRVQIPHEVRRPRRELRQHRRVLRRLLLRQGRLERCSCDYGDKKDKSSGE